MHPDWKTLVGVVGYVGLGVAGQLTLSGAMRRMEPLNGLSPGELARLFRFIFTTPAVGLGVSLLALNFVALLGLLSRADVTVVIPANAASYLLLTLLARWYLHEAIPTQRWLGVALVTVGVALVLGSSRSRAVAPTPERTAETIPLAEAARR